MDDYLIGKVLANGFVIERARVPIKNATGGCHSIGYVARAPDGRQAFAKVLDTTVDQDAEDPVADLKARVDAYLYERNVVMKTRERRMSGVVRAIDFGEIDLTPNRANPAYYVLFELADGDLREQVELARRFDLAYRLRVLHNTAKGLAQLHTARIAHQDLKPSNVVTFSNGDRRLGETTKIADFGHAHDRATPRPGLDRIVAGDPAHASPEQLYGYRLDDWDTRRLSSDLYHLGGLATYLFTGVCATELLSGHLRPEHHWNVWLGGSYADVLPHLIEATRAVLDDLASDADPLVGPELVELVTHLLDPDPLRRAHPRNRAGHGGRYGLERFISRFNVLAERAEWHLARRVST